MNEIMSQLQVILEQLNNVASTAERQGLGYTYESLVAIARHLGFVISVDVKDTPCR